MPDVGESAFDAKAVIERFQGQLDAAGKEGWRLVQWEGSIVCMERPAP